MATDVGTATERWVSGAAQGQQRFTEGVQNHTRWPDTWTESMLTFLAQYRGRRHN